MSVFWPRYMLYDRLTDGNYVIRKVYNYPQSYTCRKEAEEWLQLIYSNAPVVYNPRGSEVISYWVDEMQPGSFKLLYEHEFDPS